MYGLMAFIRNSGVNCSKITFSCILIIIHLENILPLVQLKVVGFFFLHQKQSGRKCGPEEKLYNLCSLIELNYITPNTTNIYMCRISLWNQTQHFGLNWDIWGSLRLGWFCQKSFFSNKLVFKYIIFGKISCLSQKIILLSFTFLG